MSAIAHFTRRWTFVAAHRLHVDALSAEENAATFGKCNNPFGHGHNYVVQVTVSGPIDPVTGMVTNLSDLDAFARRELLDRFDHQNLNTLECFRDTVTTTENLCRELWRIFIAYPHAKLERVRVEETGNNAFDYFGEGRAARFGE
ncbi:MAG: 6-carboxytetrahydropterin synthase [Acidobacteriaceae bacterium]|nr:6-carboxytetrahydropterin synthase [Acidobacteriaceae bacterium]